MKSTADFVSSSVQAHKEHLIGHEEEANSDTTITPASPIMPALEERQISPEETFDENIDLDDAPINSTLNPNAELEKSSSSYWHDQKKVQCDSKNLESILKNCLHLLRWQYFQRSYQSLL